MRRKVAWFHPKDKGQCPCGCPSHVAVWGNKVFCRTCLIEALIEENKILRERQIEDTTCPLCGEIHFKEKE